MVREWAQKFRRWRAGRSSSGGKGGLGGRGLAVLLAVLFTIWMATGIFFVDPDEEGVKLVFGKVTTVVGPGPHWNFPAPIGRTFTPSVKNIRKLEVGFRTVSSGPPARYQPVIEEALMLTGDENIVKLDFIVQYQISDPVLFLFKLKDPVEGLLDASESAMREVIGQIEIDQALSEGKAEIQDKAHVLIQEILNQYQAGIRIVTVKLQDVEPPPEVDDAFKDVINAAQDKERKINEAKGYANNLIPAARGRAAEGINEAKGYKEARVTEAQGEARRFLSLYGEYEKAKTVTRKRLYLETMEKILPSMEKTVLPENTSKNLMPYMNIEKLQRKEVR